MAEIMNDRKLINGYVEWLSQYTWSWFGVLTFRGYPPASKARRLFDIWLLQIKKDYGSDDFRWVRITEYGAEHINIHFHILVGGLHYRPACRQKAMFLWQRLAGEANITSVR
jgi:hypothetical protein